MDRYAVIGHPVAHSLSPKMHAANGAAIGRDLSYEKIDVAPDELAATVRRLQAAGSAGLNVTIPHKVAVLPLLDRIDESARRAGACNTIRFASDGTSVGCNTDVAAFVECLAARGFSLRGKRVLIVGCGGAGRALAACAAGEGAAKILLAARRIEQSAALATGRAEAVGTDAESWTKAAGEVDLVVNATPVGLKEGEASVLPARAFRPGQLALDLIPRSDSPMARVAKAAGACVIDGIEFLVRQGAKSFEIWTGRPASRAAMTASLRGVTFVYGPPASGKTTYGRKLAAERGEAFIDLDEEIVRREGLPIPEIFARRSEAGFREAERTALVAALESVRGPTVMALGGGTLLREDNRRLCEASGKVLCLETPPAEELARRLALAPGSRPLGDMSQTRARHYASFHFRVS